MIKHSLIILVVGILVDLSASNAQAGIITIEFEGVVTTSEIFTVERRRPGFDGIRREPFPTDTTVSGVFTFNDALVDSAPGGDSDDFALSRDSADFENLSDVSAEISIRGRSFSAGPFSTFFVPLAGADPIFDVALADGPGGDEFIIRLSANGDPIFLETFSLALLLSDDSGTAFPGRGNLTDSLQDLVSLLNDDDFPVSDVTGAFFYQRVPRLSREEISAQFSLTALRATTISVPSPGFASLFLLGCCFMAGRGALRRQAEPVR